MSAKPTGGGLLKRRFRDPPIGYQHGRHSRFTRNLPTICWLYYWLNAHATPRLVVLGVVGLGPAALLMMIDYDSRILYVGFVVLAWMAVSVAAGLLACPRLRVVAQGPVRVECGSRFTTRYTVTNAGRRAARDLAVDTLIFSDWMSLRLGRARLPLLRSGATETLQVHSSALARGLYTLPALRYDSAFPCGFWRWGHTERRDRVLSVYPRYARLATLDIPLGNRHRQDLSTSRELAREALEFHGCREFRDGDALRHVHPRSSARLGVPVIKEFQTEGRSRTAVLVDTKESGLLSDWRARITRDDPAEAALSLTAAVVDALSSTDRVLELLVAGPQVYRFVSAGRVGYLEEALDILAAVEPSRTDPLDKLEPLLLDEIRAIQSVCLILIGWDARREALVRQIQMWGVGLKLVLVTARGQSAAGLPDDAVCISARALLRGEVNSL